MSSTSVRESTSIRREPRTVRLWAKVGHDISDTDVNDAEETLILLLELLLIKHLYCEDTAFVGSAVSM